MTRAERPSPREQFAARLRAARRARGFRTAKSFAEALGIEQNTYTRYERAEVEPNIAVIERMWAALDLAPNDLFGTPPGDQRWGAIRGERGRFVPVDPRDKAAWELAAAYVRATPQAGQTAGSDAEFRRFTTVFADLARHPYETAGRLALDIDLSAADASARDTLVAAFARFTKLLK
jgi:transcriptional regulator with XRE-family HTH domain